MQDDGDSITALNLKYVHDFNVETCRVATFLAIFSCNINELSLPERRRDIDK